MAAGRGVTTDAGAPVSYTTRVTATSGAEQHAVEVTLVLQPVRQSSKRDPASAVEFLCRLRTCSGCLEFGSNVRLGEGDL